MGLQYLRRAIDDSNSFIYLLKLGATNWPSTFAASTYDLITLDTFVNTTNKRFIIFCKRIIHHISFSL